MLFETTLWCALLGIAAGPLLRMPVERLAPAGPGAGPGPAHAGARGPGGLGPGGFTPDRFTPDRFTPDRFTPDRFTPGRLTPGRLTLGGLDLGLLTGALFAVLSWRVGPGLDLAAFLVLAAAGVALALVDVRALRLPDALTLVVFLTGLTLLGMESLALGDTGPYLRALCGALTLGAYHLCLAMLHRGGLGAGDVKLAAVLGLHLCWLGWGALVVGAAAAFVLAGAAAAVLLATRRARRGTPLPFGPWMLAGALVGVLCGEQVTAWYLGV